MSYIKVSTPASSDEESFLAKILIDEDGCWIWQASQRGGYGAFRQHLAHRWSYENWKGPIPVNLQLDHLCRKHLCTNPDCLEPVTQKENLNRGINYQSSKDVCKYGHEFTVENTYRFGPEKKYRGCRTCRNANRQGKDPATYVRHAIGHNQWS